MIDFDRFRTRLTGGRPAVPDVPGKQQVAPKYPSNNLEGTTGDKSVLGEKLEATADKGLDKAQQILAIPLDPDRAHYPAELRAQTALINTAVTTQVRVDETRMRPPRIDRLPDILRMIAEEEARLPKCTVLSEEPAADAEEESRLRRSGIIGGEPDG
jgi:hypothetical protein